MELEGGLPYETCQLVRRRSPSSTTKASLSYAFFFLPLSVPSPLFLFFQYEAKDNFCEDLNICKTCWGFDEDCEPVTSYPNATISVSHSLTSLCLVWSGLSVSLSTLIYYCTPHAFLSFFYLLVFLLPPISLATLYSVDDDVIIIII